MRAEFDTRELRSLIVDLDKQPIGKTKKFERVVDDAAGALVLLWKRNERELAPEGHAKHYIRGLSYARHGLTATVGPYMDKGSAGASMRQAEMNFEYGNMGGGRSHQPPHLSGNRAADDVFRVLPKRALDAAELDL